ncbi:MAG: AAA family ATPase [Actinomycetia bacterium]|nr:AAA family ATPase [Actinomycetes bacterium]
MKRFHRGFVMGKFYPLHAGHQNLIRHAQALCEQVEVHVYESSVESVPGAVRADWVRREHPSAVVVLGFDDLPIDFTSAAAWDAHLAITESLLTGPVDAVFTSDAYGAELARRLGATWVQVDAGRTQLPVSGTAVRADPAGYWWALPPTVREWFCRRVVVLGAESTGSTTLAEDLAGHFGVPVTLEYGREWSEVRPGGPWAPWASAEFDLIAAEHRRRERQALGSSPKPLVISDTDNLATAVWHERYLEAPSPTVTAAATAFPPDLYLLTGDEIAFVQDGWRDGEHIRHTMQQRFREVLAEQPVPWVELHGSRDQRLARAVELVDDLLRRGWNLADPHG